MTVQRRVATLRVTVFTAWVIVPLLLVTLPQSASDVRTIGENAMALLSSTPTPLDRFTSADRLLIVAPHPDDESLCCAGIARRAVRDGAQVSVVWVTNGDGSAIDAWLLGKRPPTGKTFRQLGTVRIAEAQAAAASLGIQPEAQFFLGFPDSSLQRVLAQQNSVPLRAPRTKVSYVPYTNAWLPNAPYSATELEENLRAVLRRTAPTLVLAPCEMDLHPDHAALGKLLPKLVHQVSEATLGCWIVHAARPWPQQATLSSALPLFPPKTHPSLHWTFVPLSEAEREAKRGALEHYTSQRRTMERFMFSFVRANELIALEASTP